MYKSVPIFDHSCVSSVLLDNSFEAMAIFLVNQGASQKK